MSDPGSTDNPRIVLGSNNPPPSNLKELLANRYQDMIARFEALMATFGTVPGDWTDDETQGKAQDLFKDMRQWKGRADSDRKLEKEPWQKAAAEVDAFFKTPMDKLEAAQKALKERLDRYLTAKAERARIEAQRRAQEEQRRADEERRRAEEETRKAEEARKRAAEEVRLADEARKRREIEEAAAAAAKRRSRRIQAVTPYLARRAGREAAYKADVEEKAAAKKAAEQLAREQAAAERKRLEDEAREAKARSAEHRKTERKAEGAADDALDTMADATDAAALAGKTAERADKSGARLERQAGGSAADLSRTRSEDGGTVGSLAKRWVAEVVNMDLLLQGGDNDGSWATAYARTKQLLQYVHRDAIEAAVTKAMTAGVRDLPGVHYEEVEEGRFL